MSGLRPPCTHNTSSSIICESRNGLIEVNLHVVHRMMIMMHNSTYRCYSQQIKHATTVFPCIHIAILAETFVIKSKTEKQCVQLAAISRAICGASLFHSPVDLSDLSWFMIPSQQCDSIWISGLQRHQSGQCFQTEIAPIDEVAHEYVVCVRHWSAVSEQLFQIIKLSKKKNAFEID